jgi:hypothetical protein
VWANANLRLPLHADSDALALRHFVFFNRASERFLPIPAGDREGHPLGTLPKLLPCAWHLAAIVGQYQRQRDPERDRYTEQDRMLVDVVHGALHC